MGPIVHTRGLVWIATRGPRLFWGARGPWPWLERLDMGRTSTSDEVKAL